MSAVYWHALGDPAGAPTLAVHCALGRGRDLAGMIGRVRIPLAVRALDLPGHGASALWDGLGDYHTACTDAARAGLDQPSIVIGHSLGATIALRLSLENPTLVRALVLIEPVLFAAAQGTSAMVTHKVLDDRFADLMSAGDHMGAAAQFLGLWGVGMPFAKLPVPDRARIIAQLPLIVASKPALFDDTANLLGMGKLEGLRTPVLLLRGSMSPPVTHAINAALAARLPQAHLAQVAGAGHMAPLTHASDVAAQITHFLEAVKDESPRNQCGGFRS